jgi:maleate isomerase
VRGWQLESMMNRRHFIRLTGTAAIGAPVLTATGLGAAAASQWQPDGNGAVARIGVLTPDFDPVPESELSAMAPKGVSVHGSRVSWNRQAGAFAEPPHIDTAVERLAELAPRAIAVGFTSSSYVHGPAADEPLRLRLEKISRDVPVVLSAPAAVDALRALAVRRVAVIHPPWFNDEVNARGRDYFQLQGFEVVLCAQLKPARSFTEVPAPEVFNWVRANAPQQAEAILLSGNGLRAVGTIQELERRLRRPVLTANQVLFWAALRAARVTAKVTQYGSLFGKRDGGPQP